MDKKIKSLISFICFVMGIIVISVLFGILMNEMSYRLISDNDKLGTAMFGVFLTGVPFGSGYISGRLYQGDA